jgi:hypothetical protein
MIRRPIFGVENNSTRTVVRQAIAREFAKKLLLRNPQPAHNPVFTESIDRGMEFLYIYEIGGMLRQCIFSPAS